MKFLHIKHAYFKLPDDFNGTKDEAYRLLADCLTDPVPFNEGVIPGHKSDEEALQIFLGLELRFIAKSSIGCIEKIVDQISEVNQ